MKGWRGGIGGGPIFSDSRQNNYFYRYDNVSGAVFAASPLVERKSNLAVGIAVSRIVKVSKRTVTETED
jgi:hypothetical protein